MSFKNKIFRLFYTNVFIWLVSFLRCLFIIPGINFVAKSDLMS